MPIQDVNAHIAAVNSVYPTVEGGLTVDSGTFDEAAVITAGGITDPPDGPIPEIGDNAEVRINSDRLHTGQVEESGRDGENLVQLSLFSGERRLHQNTLTREYTDAAPGEVVRAAFEQANIQPLPEAYPFAADFGAAYGDQAPIFEAALREARQSEEIAMTAEFNRTPCVVAIQQACLAAGWEWKLTADGRGWYGHPGLANTVANDPDTAAPSDFFDTVAGRATPRTWNLRWVLSDGTSPQFQKRAFDTIRVVGKPVEITSSGAPQPITNPILAQVSVGSVGENETPRVHLYRDDRITSQSMANNIARSMWRNVQRQRSKGTVRVVGDTRLRPLDSCRMLPERSESEGGDFYHVNSVVHRIDSEGFVTDVGVSGYVDLADVPDIDPDPSLQGQVVSETNQQSPAQTNG